MENKHFNITSTIEQEIIDFRRHMHQYPELSNEEHNTTKFIKEELTKLGLETIELKGKPGVVGLLKNSKSTNSKTILIRADIDALPMQELTTHGFKSKNDGVMHSCGHDGHSAAAIGAIKILLDNLDEFDGNIKFLFQHAEEIGLGAKEWAEGGILSNPSVDAVLGYHIMPISEGKIGIKNNALCAASTIFEVILTGKGGHGAYPHKCNNPINIAIEIIQKVQNFIVNRFDALDSLVISFCTVNAGTKDNIIPETVRMSGTIRCLKPEVGEKAFSLLREKAKKIAELNDATCEVNILAEIPALINDPSLNEVIKNSTIELYGEESVMYLENASMGSEDFGHLKKEGIEGAYFYIGYSDKDGKYSELNHSTKFDFDEKILLPLSTVTAKTIINYFKGDK